MTSLTLYDIILLTDKNGGDRMASKAQAKATYKWEKDNYFKTQVRFKKSDEQRIRAAVGDGSLNGFIVKCVLDRLDGTEPDCLGPVSTSEPEKPVKKPGINGISPELQQLFNKRKSENDAKKEQIERAKEARKEFDREETCRRDPDRKTDIRDASKAPETEEEKTDKAFYKGDAEIQALLEEAKQIVDTEENKKENEK